MTKYYRILLYWLPVLVWGTVIFSFSATHAIVVSNVHAWDFLVHKIAHFCEYFILSALIYRALHGTTKVRGKYLLLMTLTLTVLYSVTDEFHQSFTPGREPRIRDVIIDSFGSAVALAVLTKVWAGTRIRAIASRHVTKNK